MQDWAEVHRLFHREHWTKTAIAEKLGMSRNTVDRLWSCPSHPAMSGDRRARPSTTTWSRSWPCWRRTPRWRPR